MSRNMLFITITTVYFTVPFGVVLSGCGQDEWGCNDGRTCIKQYQKCDLRSDCPSGEDELNCPCIENQWQCDDGTCISKNLRCNNKVDCPRDNSDERSCPPPTPTVRECTVSEFTCRNGLCIDLQRKCDRKPDCTDNSDEQTCPCTPNDFKCGNGYCIPYSQRCDSNRNCQDGSDEENCSVHCQPDEFKCRDGACINKTLVCNKRRDCADASDEDNCETCRADQFRCSDGLCLMINQLCNGHQECTNGEDERNCGYIGPVVCRENEFECRDKTCIDQSKHCNGYPDCKDLSDEENCEAMLAPCPLSDFTCPDGSCIPMRKHCDGKSDCPGNHDEIGCADDIPCGANEYTCSDGRCIMKEQQCDRHYDCTDGGDERNCSTRCSNHEYTCSDGRCIRKEQQCDKRYDCADGGDERNCSTRCSNHEYTCSDGRCIRKEQQCDKRYDCADGGDERNCSCEPGEFQCDRSRCIPYSLVCNHYPDCNDKTDELNCGQCKSYQFSCTYGGCIDLNEKCDRKYDCPDGSDEENCGGSEFTTQATQRVSCNYTQFPCDSGDQCVPLSAHCDNNYDCRDYSDEENCAGNPRGLDLRTYPANQIIKESREVVFQCRDEGPLRVPVRWTRQDGQLPPGSRDIRGRLEMPNIQLEHTGTYVCEAVGYSSSTHGSKVTVFLRVEPFDQPSTRPPKACAIGEATCSNGECIPKHYVCNGQYDCSDGSDELRCNPHGCEPNEFRCDNKKCVRKTWLCDSEDDCGDGSDERNCGANLPGSPCRYNEFECKSGNQCIPKSFHCDLEIDCQDGSDEVGCSKVYIQTPPPPMIVLEPGNVFTITCTAVGVPTPEVVWRLNWGHIPEKCSVTSNGGFGTLTCPDIQESDQGAYSCEAMNSRGSVFAIPDTILVVKGPQGVCPRGTFNQLARTSDECISCFCFGVTSECKSADLFIYQLLPPVDVFRVVNVQITPSGGIEIRKEESHYQSAVRPLTRNGFQLSATENDLKSYTFVESQYPYFALPEAYYGNQLKSYGGYIKYVVEFGGTGSQLNIPDVILTGNGYTLVYRGSPLYPRRKNEVAVRYFPGNWYRLVESHSGPGGDINFEFQKEVLATREDLMMALYNVDNILIRAQYLSNELDTTILDINMDSAGVRNTGQGKAAYVEECSCPAGYSGLSCEKCSQGFLRQDVGPWLGKCYNDTPPCSPGTYGDPKRGIPCQTCPCPYTSPANQFSRTCQLDSDGDVTCDCPAGYIGRRCEQCADGYAGNPLVPGDSCRQSYCDPAGSVFSAPEPTTGHCVCKDYTTGPTCNQCKANTFYLASSNIFGCISCFCMGINTTCTSSNMYRNQVSSAFTRDNQDFKLALANKPDETISNIEVNPSAREIIYRQFTPEVYYWVLPSKFLYNKVTSYGGNLRYTLRYVPTPGGQISRNNAPDVEIISDNEVRLLYFSREQIEPNKLVTITVPLLEQYWQRVDGQAANREHLLMALAELDNILIKATYTTNTQEAALISVSLDIADERNTGQSRAIEVEQCACPQGYRGTSCEECDAGYTRVDEGLYLGICEPCNCNGHSTQCDSDSGVCLNCGDHTEGDQCNVCQPGYVGNPLSGGVCQPESPTTCVCDPRGSIHTNCNARNQCVCKTNVEGQQCDQCREGTFDLSAYHPEGCLECYCSGVAHSCQSSNLYITQIPTQIIDQSHNFTLTDANRQHVIRDGFLLNVEKNEIGYDFSNQQGQRLFWSLPPAFTGNKVTSYGGNLTFTQHYNSAPSAAPYYDTDVVIIGTTSSLFWTANDILQPSVPKTVTVPLVETNWHRLDPSSQPSSRSDLLTALSNIEAILIRASYSNQTVQSFLSDVSLDTAVSQHTGQGIATAVEVCRCPTGYKGTSCESCSGGYYEDYDGTCKKCPCNNNEVSCLLGVSREVECKCKAQYRGLYCETVGPMDNNQDVEPSIPPSRPSTNPLPTINVSILEPIIQIVETGKTVRYRCTGKSQGPVRLEWKKEGGDLPPGRAIDDRQGTLTITNVRVTDSGTYICRAFDGYSFVTERVQLTVGGGPESLPRVTVQPRYLHVREGEPVEFHCTASGNPQPVLKWVGGQNNRLNPQSSFVNGIFYIPYATRSDEANYQCIATNTKGSDAESVVLYVREPDIPTEVTPLNRLDVQPSEYSGSPGDTVRLHCVSSGQHNIQIRWSRYDGKPLPASATDQNGVLTIYSVNPDDAGIYVCTAFEASTGVREQVQARINIISSRLPPRIHIEPDTQTVSQGSIAELHCLASDNQHVNFQWSKVGDDLPSNVQINGGVLRILSAQVKDRGVYVCKIEGPAGIAQSSAIIEIKRREAPTVELYPKATQTVVEGRSAIFQCRLTGGVPLPTLQWSRPNKEPLSSRVEQLSSGVLRFNSVTRAEEGQYICTAENEAGSITAVGSLEVHTIPMVTIYPAGPVFVSPGQRVRLECRASGYPQPQVQWSKHQHQSGLVLYTSQAVTSRTPQSAIYVISSAMRGDEGSYTCLATNDAGLVEERIQVFVVNESTSGPTRGDIPSVDGSSLATHTGGGVIIEDEDFSVPVGGYTQMRCIVRENDQNIFLKWIRRDGKPLSPSHWWQDGILYIKNAQLSDAGEYSCQGIDPSGSILFSANARLVVTVGNKLCADEFGAPPRITLEPTRQVVRPGDNARIICSATGDQPIEITWSAVGKVLPSSVSTDRGYILFQGITAADAGRYVCRARNSAGESESVAEVIVNEHTHGSHPVVTAIDRNQRAIEGSSVQLRCDTDNRTEITWTREYQPLPSSATLRGSILRIDGLRPEDAGRYICHANSVSDYIDLSVDSGGCKRSEFRCENTTCIPLEAVCDGHQDCIDGLDEQSCQLRPGRDLDNIELRIEPSRHEVQIGDTLDLRCLVDGYPGKQITWNKADDNLGSNVQVSGTLLRITNADIHNGGVYRCSTSVRSGTVDKDYILNVEDKPNRDAESVQTITAAYGKTVVMDCRTDLEPPVQFTWTKHGSVLPAKATVKDEKLSIPNVTYKDAGNYICTASNGQVSVDIPKLITVTGAVPFFAQAPVSYLALPTLPNAYLNFNIGISFKPEHPNGLILYNGQQRGGEGDFVSLGLRNGVPEFRFDMGSGPAVIHGASPVSMGQWHTIQISRQRKNGSMYVDDEGPFVGSGPKKYQGLDLFQQLFIGGVPDYNDISKLNGFESGFVGCISRLVIDKVEHDLIQDARLTEGVTNCETCAINPCLNNGVCQEAPTKQGYTCLCPRGFSGENCARIGEACYPGACGTGRCMNVEEGLECYCQLHKSGFHCEHDISITVPSFSKKAYLAYPTPKALRKLKIALKFSAKDTADGLLFYCAQNEDGQGDFVSLAIKDGRVEFRFDTGSGPSVLQSTRNIIPGQWITVSADRDYHEGRLSVSGELPVSAPTTGRTKGLNLRTPLFIGGYDKQHIKLSNGVGVKHGFSGCISEVEVSGLNLNLIHSAVDAANVEECSADVAPDPCQHQTCNNHGDCLPTSDGRHFECYCHPGYSGTTCENNEDICAVRHPCQNRGSCIGNSSYYKCNCPLGYGGVHCEQNVELATEVRFQGDGYIELDNNLLPHTNPDERETITVEFSTHSQDAVILWHGQMPDTEGKGQDYLSLAIVNGYLELSFELGSGPAEIRASTKKVNDGARHIAVIERQASDGSLELDGDITEIGESPGGLTQLNTKGSIYLGGLPNVDLMTGGRYVHGLHGCIHSLDIQNSGHINFSEKALSAINAQPCTSSFDDYEDNSTQGRRDEIIH